MSDVVAFDVVEDILIRLDVKDLIRFKSVCKLWHSLISSSRFVKNHMNYAYNKDNSNKEIGHRRVLMPSLPGPHKWGCHNRWQIVGSSNGLVCISPADAQVLVTNPSTREVRNLTTPHIPSMLRFCVYWGFGYDSSIDDYKVVVGSVTLGGNQTCFQLLTLKSNTWKHIGLVQYKCISPFGTFYNGVIYWIMDDTIKRKHVIMSFDLSLEEFKEIPQPNDIRYDVHFYPKFNYLLGVYMECLCLFRFHDHHLSCDTWVMRNYNVKHSFWELPFGHLDNTWKYSEQDQHIYAYTRTMHDVAHTLKHDIQRKTFFCDDDEICLPKPTNYISAHIFVQSLVSPHVNGGDSSR